MSYHSNKNLTTTTMMITCIGITHIHKTLTGKLHNRQCLSAIELYSRANKALIKTQNLCRGRETKNRQVYQANNSNEQRMYAYLAASVNYCIKHNQQNWHQKKRKCINHEQGLKT